MKPIKYIHLTGMTEFAARAEQAVANGTTHTADTSKDWAGSTFNVALTRAREGDLSRVEASDRMLARLEDIAPQSTGHETFNVVAGGVPNVPAYLSGSPVNMRMRRRVLSEGAPVAVLANGFFSAGVDHKTIERRGAAIMALVRLLSASRPVTLYWYMLVSDNGKPSLTTVPIETAPLDLARAAWMLTAPEAFRQTAFPIHREAIDEKHDTVIEGYPGYSQSDAVEAARITAAALGFADFVGVPPIVIGTEFKTDADAAKWVRDHLTRITSLAA